MLKPIFANINIAFMKRKEYHNGDMTIVWEPEKCIHAAECVKRLPKVYNPREKPWMKPENASVEDLKDQIDHCPSGALSYYLKSESQTKNKTTMNNTNVTIKANGPLIVMGNFTITHPDGKVEEIEKLAALCRCGASSKKPFCDGAHGKVGFQG